MLIVFYRTRLCPRCYLARKWLSELTRNVPDLHIDEREVLHSPRQILHEGIRMIPAIRIGDQILSGAVLTKRKINDFLRKNGCQPQKLP